MSEEARHRPSAMNFSLHFTLCSGDSFKSGAPRPTESIRLHFVPVHQTQTRTWEYGV